MDEEQKFDHILWHFTGGPKWSQSNQRQATKKKTIEEAYKNLCKIYSSKKLLVGDYHELIRVERRPNLNTNKRENNSIQQQLLHTAKVCCVAEISINQLFDHSKRYGKIAIGFKRESLLSAGFNPVFYTLENKQIASNFYKAQETLSLFDIDASPLEELQSEIYDIFSRNHIEETVDIDCSLAGIQDSADEVRDALTELENALAFVKTFSEGEFDTIYKEREWRSINDFHFTYSDVAVVLMPHNYLAKFIKNRKHRSQIKMLSWEEICSYSR